MLLKCNQYYLSVSNLLPTRSLNLNQRLCKTFMPPSIFMRSSCASTCSISLYFHWGRHKIYFEPYFMGHQFQLPDVFLIFPQLSWPQLPFRIPFRSSVNLRLCGLTARHRIGCLVLLKRNSEWEIEKARESINDINTVVCKNRKWQRCYP